MGKAARAVCITLPWVLTVASFVLVVLIHLSGRTSSSSLNGLRFAQIDFSNLTTSDSTSELSIALEAAKSSGTLSDIYQIHLWDYCSGNVTTTDDKTTTKITYCSPRKTNFWFDPLTVWGLNTTSTSAITNTTSSDLTAELSNEDSTLEGNLLGSSAHKALDAYQKVSHWLFIAYMVSLFSLLATIFLSLIALFSRIGSIITWIAALIAALFTTAASVTATALFASLVTGLKATLHAENVSVTLSTSFLKVTWLATLFIDVATLFWLFSACCCSGKSNPHHRSNEKTPWAAHRNGHYANGGMQGPNGFDYANAGAPLRGRSLKAEQSGGYQRVASPYLEQETSYGNGGLPMRDVSPEARQGYGHVGGGGGGLNAGYYGSSAAPGGYDAGTYGHGHHAV